MVRSVHARPSGHLPLRRGFAAAASGAADAVPRAAGPSRPAASRLAAARSPPSAGRCAAATGRPPLLAAGLRQANALEDTLQARRRICIALCVLKEHAWQVA